MQYNKHSFPEILCQDLILLARDLFYLLLRHIVDYLLRFKTVNVEHTVFTFKYFLRLVSHIFLELSTIWNSWNTVRI